MTNASIRNTFSVLSVFAVSVALSMGVFVISAHAADLDGGYDLGGGGDLGGYDLGGYGDLGGYDLGGYGDLG